MPHSLYATFTALIVALLLPASLPARANVIPIVGNEVLGVRVGLIPGRTRVVFDLSQAAPYTLTTLSNPQRVVLELQASRSDFDHHTVKLKGSHIDKIRAGNQPNEALRYVFDVTQEIEPRVFPLKPYRDHGHRLVLDLYLPEWADELNAVNLHAQEPPLQLAARDTNIQRQTAVTPQSATKIPNPVSSGSSGEWSGYVSLETRLFLEDAAHPKQDDQNVSVAFEPQYYQDWDRGKQRIAFKPFFRFDANDSERTHADIREMYWRIEHQKIVFKAGLDVVFWGVAESQHLVDIINQSDLVENIDGEDKLGQPMLNLDYMTDDWGTWQAFILPYFRERTFPGEQGRLRTQPAVDTNNPLYDSDDEEKHVDFALRWSHYIGDWDIGFAHFSGTSRNPIFIPSTEGGRAALRPLYLQIEQSSLDVQATTGAWLWKLEAIYNSNRIEDYYASVGGFEYTWFGVGDSAADLGWLLEYHYDERGKRSLSPLQDDIFAGIRYSGNDIAGTRVLAGIIVDADSQSTFGNLEAVRRLGESWTITLEARMFSNIDKADPLQALDDDDYIELQLSRFF
ncbi:MAG: hypothetical protein ACI9JM_000064 [Halioglobus sp.]